MPPPPVAYMEPIARFVDAIAFTADDVARSASPAPDPASHDALVVAAIERVTERLLTKFDDAEASLRASRAAADRILHEATQNAARIIAEAEARADLWSNAA